MQNNQSPTIDDVVSATSSLSITKNLESGNQAHFSSQQQQQPASVVKIRQMVGNSQLTSPSPAEVGNLLSNISPEVHARIEAFQNARNSKSKPSTFRSYMGGGDTSSNLNAPSSQISYKATIPDYSKYHSPSSSIPGANSNTNSNTNSNISSNASVRVSDSASDSASANTSNNVSPTGISSNPTSNIRNSNITGVISNSSTLSVVSSSSSPSPQSTTTNTSIPLSNPTVPFSGPLYNPISSQTKAPPTSLSERRGLKFSPGNDSPAPSLSLGSLRSPSNSKNPSPLKLDLNQINNDNNSTQSHAMNQSFNSVSDSSLKDTLPNSDESNHSQNRDSISKKPESNTLPSNTITEAQTISSMTPGKSNNIDKKSSHKNVGLTLNLDGGKPVDIFSNHFKYIDIKTGSLNFAGKASLHSKGIDFSSGSKFRISLDEFQPLGELGRGNYGTVTKVLHKPTNIIMAMKEIRLELEESKFLQIIMELEVLHKCVSPYIVDFYGAFFVEGAVYLCMEYMDGGSLDKIYQGGVDEQYLAVITEAVVRGLKQLKDNHNIIHRDVKPTNILVSTSGKVKLCDFGVSGNLVASIAKTNIGCQSYMAPERIKAANPEDVLTYTVQSDIWSLGLSVLEVAMGSYPYPPETYSNLFSQLSAIIYGDTPSLPPERFSPEARSFVANCLNKSPGLRPTYAKLLAHPWLKKYSGVDVDLGDFVEKALERNASTSASASLASPVVPPLHKGRGNFNTPL